MLFSEKLRLARANAGMTQQELADAAGTTRRTIVSYETTDARPRAGACRRLAEALGVSYRYLADDAVQESAPAAATPSAEAMEAAGDVLRRCGALFAGGDLSEEEKDTLFVALAKAYLQCREERDKGGEA